MQYMKLMAGPIAWNVRFLPPRWELLFGKATVRGF
jgi:hypothetical protein